MERLLLAHSSLGEKEKKNFSILREWVLYNPRRECHIFED